MVDPTLVEVLSDPLPCACDCHATLTLDERARGVAALCRFDDAMRGWGYRPLYAVGAHRLWREAQARNDRTYRRIAVRDHACLYRRLLGFAVHETLHALCGDPAAANHGIPFGLPYGVPDDLPATEEKAYLHRFNQQEARAFVGVTPLAEALFGVRWAVYTARDVGTYGFAGGMALVDVPRGFRPVPHVDRQHHPDRYYALARRLEREAEAWLDAAQLAELVARFEAAEAVGRAARAHPWPDPVGLAARPPRAVRPTEACPCGSGRVHRRCCAAG